MSAPRRSSGSISGGGGDSPPGIFICYRQQDSAAQALRIYRVLAAAFGEERVFMDVSIPPAVDFVDWIERSIGASGVVMPVIGRTWLAPDASGRPRIENERDFVRNEIAGALSRGIEVLPVLVDGAAMPSEEELPADLARLTRLQAHHLRTDADWRSSEENLVKRVAELVGEDGGSRQPPPLPQRWPGLVPIGLLGAALLVVGLVVLWQKYITPPFQFLTVAPGFFTSVAPVGVLVGAVLALALASREATTTWLRVGLFAGFAFEAAAKGLSLLGDSSSRVQAGGLLWLLGGAMLGVAAVIAARHVSKRVPAESPNEPRYTPTAFAAIAGATMLVVGTVIPFNIAKPPGGEPTDRIILSDHWLAADPFGTALAVVVAVGLLLAGRRSLAAGLLLALGLASALLWVRYIGIPVAQWSTPSDVASPQAGGFVGLAGSVVVFCAGWRLAAVRSVSVPAARPVPTT